MGLLRFLLAMSVAVWHFGTPGPTSPSHVVAISGWIPPWFHANVEVGGVVGTVMHGVLQFGAPVNRK